MSSYYVYRKKIVTTEVCDFVKVSAATEEEAKALALQGKFDALMQELPETRKELSQKISEVYKIEKT